MGAKRWLRRIYLCYFSRPVGERALYRACRRQAPKSIVEIGVGTGQRISRLMEFVLESHAASDVRYVGIDLFEARSPDSPGLGLKQAHAQFKPLGIKLQLVPGDPHSALSRVANAVRDVDWLVIAADVDRESMTRAWPFVPRMLNATTRVYVEEPGTDGKLNQYRELTRAEVESFAAQQQKSARKAA